MRDNLFAFWDCLLMFHLYYTNETSKTPAATALYRHKVWTEKTVCGNDNDANNESNDSDDNKGRNETFRLYVWTNGWIKRQ